MSATSKRPLLDRVMIRFRLLGWLVLVFGAFAFRYYISAYLNPTMKIIVNNSPTADPQIKLLAALFSGLFLLFGIFFALTPRRILEGLFRWHFKIGSDLFGIPNPLAKDDQT